MTFTTTGHAPAPTTTPSLLHDRPTLMHFIDECQLLLEAGDGGNGAVAFRREKFVPMGGPAGGDGGRGGDIVFVGAGGLGTLQDLQHQRVIRAPRGADGGAKDMYGRAGTSVEVRVPLGTVVTDAKTRAVLAEILHDGQRVVIARGGHGGRGNIHFATPVDRAPRKAELGRPGQKLEVRLELKVMADVGLVGFPNAGKSTLISSVSRARPKVADYPFTTRHPHLGVVTVGDQARGLGRTFVMADIPGLVEGASEGAGLGHRFLRHVERTRVLVHLVTVSPDPERTPLADYDAIRRELERFSPALATRPEVVVMSKADLPDVRDAYPAFREALAARGIDTLLISAVTHAGLDEALERILTTLAAAAPAPASAEPQSDYDAQTDDGDAHNDDEPGDA